MRETAHRSNAVLSSLLYGKLSEDHIIPGSYRIISAKGPAKKVSISFHEKDDHEYLSITVLLFK